MVELYIEHDFIPTDPRRLEAFHRYEQCLADGRPLLLEGFVENLLLESPPPLDLLQDIIDDLQNHLMTLRQQHFDLRERIVESLKSIYQVDITPLTPTKRWDDYYLLDAEQVVTMVKHAGFDLSEDEAIILRDMIESSTHICTGLVFDIDLTERLCQMIHDWLVAYLPLQSEANDRVQ